MSAMVLVLLAVWAGSFTATLLFLLLLRGGTRLPPPVVPRTQESSPPAEAGGELVHLEVKRRRSPPRSADGR